MINKKVATGEGSDLLAAIDLGSNSFHLIVAKSEFGELRPVHVLAEKIQLGETSENAILTSGAIERGLACLERFKQLINNTCPVKTRVVGTNALRRAKNRRAFIEPAEEILQTSIDVIYGREEARLIYLGVAHTLSDDENTRLVIDIGGGSTEFILGERFEPIRLESLQLGCVSYGKAFFPDGKISHDRFTRAYQRARLEVSHIRRNFNAGFWQEAVGSSGTLRSIEGIIVASGWRTSGIDRGSLKKLKSRLLTYEHVDKIQLEGLSEARKGVVTAGLAITIAIFDGLQITQMRTSSGALREGVIYDLIGRLTHEDVRKRTILAMQKRYCVDRGIAELVSQRVRLLAQTASEIWHLTDRDMELLAWAGEMHEIGISVSQKNYPMHSAYLILNSDLPGFSQQDQEMMATLVAGLKRKFKPGLTDPIPAKHRQKVARMTALLRIAVILKHVENSEEMPKFSTCADQSNLSLSIPKSWSERHPLTIWEIEHSKNGLENLGVTLRLKAT